MRAYKQTNSRWKNKRLGTCNVTIGTHGCFVVALSMLADKRPDEVNDLLRDKGGYSQGCLVNSSKAARILGLDYLAKTIYESIAKDYSDWIICETDFYKKNGYNQHFFLKNLKTNEQLDPLGGSVIYPVVSFRLFRKKIDNLPKKKGEFMDENAVKKLCHHILHQVWRSLHNYKSPDDSSVKKEVDRYLAKYIKGEDWAFSSLIDGWYNEEIDMKLKNYASCEQSSSELKDEIQRLEKELKAEKDKPPKIVEKRVEIPVYKQTECCKKPTRSLSLIGRLLDKLNKIWNK